MPKVTPEQSVVYNGNIYPAGVEADVDAETSAVLKDRGGAPETVTNGDGAETGQAAQNVADTDSKPSRGRKAT